MVDIDRIIFCGQVPNVTHAGFHGKIFTEYFFDGFGFRWRLYDQEVFGHGSDAFRR
jgi:hypothetical protein